jgi:hypothetical protein
MESNKCPECGKEYIEIRYYKNGDKLYVHEKWRDKYMSWPHMKGCLVKK